MLSSDEESDDDLEPLKTCSRSKSATAPPRQSPTPKFSPPRMWEAGQTPRVWDADNSANKLRFFKKDCTHITDNIFVAGRIIASDREALEAKGITHILNSAGDACDNYFPDEFTYLRLFLLDKTEEDIMSVVYDCFDFIVDALQQGGKVLVHCHQGVSRSCVLTIAYLMLTLNKEFEECFQIVRKHRKICRPNIGFMCQLLAWRKRCIGESQRSSIYRIGPHCSRDRTRLVSRLVEKADVSHLDSRTVFVVSLPDAVCIWAGKNCVCKEAFIRAANKQTLRLQRYERASQKVVIFHQANLTGSEEEKKFCEAMGGDVANVTSRAEYDEDYTFTAREHEAIRDGYSGPPLQSYTRSSKRAQSMADLPSFSSKRKEVSNSSVMYNIEEAAEDTAMREIES